MILNELSETKFDESNDKFETNYFFKDNGHNQVNYLNMEHLNTQLRIIEVRIEFTQIGEVDTMNEKFQAIVKTKAKWFENEIINDYDPKEHWNPKLFIENALHDKFNEEVSYNITSYDDKTMITETRISKGLLST